MNQKNKKNEIIAWGATFVTLGICFIIALLTSCATVPQAVTEHESAVDTAVSELQTEQASSAVTAEQIHCTAEKLEQIAEPMHSEALSATVTELRAQSDALTAQLAAERATTAGIADKYEQVKNDYSDMSVKYGAVVASSKVKTAWLWRLGVALAVTVIGIVGYIIIKIKL